MAAQSKPAKKISTHSLRHSVAAVGIGFYLLLSSATAQATDGYIRVNQLGYEFGRLMRAHLMAPGSATGATFSILNSRGATVYTAPVGASVGAWGDFTVYPSIFACRKRTLTPSR
jgi:hypothetical protein